MFAMRAPIHGKEHQFGIFGGGGAIVDMFIVFFVIDFEFFGDVGIKVVGGYTCNSDGHDNNKHLCQCNLR
jgi:hypothetical protein